MPLHLRGVVLPEAVPRDVYVVDGRITFEAVADAETVCERGYLTPGLVDAHAHLEMFSPAGDDAPPHEQVRASAEAQLAAGVLALREPGGPSHASLAITSDPVLPRIFCAGRLLAPPDRYVPGLARPVTDDELPAAAEEEARASGAWAKVVGDFPVPGGPIVAHYRPATLAEAARRVHAVGARIALHAMTRSVIEAGIEAGFDTIEHGNFLEPDMVDEMARRNVALVPTLTIVDGIRRYMSREMAMPAHDYARLLEALERQPSTIALAAHRGVTVLAGTDAGMVTHGIVADEIANLLAAGLTPEAAMGAGSWHARRFFGLPCIEEGAPADIVAYTDDPRSDPEVLRKPALRILGGRLLA